jgi:hypothetical protein
MGADEQKKTVLAVFFYLLRLIDEHDRDVITNFIEEEAFFAQQAFLSLQLQGAFALGAGQNFQQFFTNHLLLSGSLKRFYRLRHFVYKVE